MSEQIADKIEPQLDINAENIEENMKTQCNITITPETPQPPTPISFYHSKFYPTGTRIEIRLPFNSSDNTPIISCRVDPYFQSTYMPVKTLTTELLSFLDQPVSLFSGLSEHGNGDVVLSNIGGVCLPSIMAASHRFWRGSIKYRLRCNISALAQANVVIGLTRGNYRSTKNYTLSGNTSYGSVPKVITPRVQNINNIVGIEWLNTELVADKHIEFSVPYENELEWMDASRGLFERVFMTEQAATFAGYCANQTDSYWHLFFRGTANAVNAGTTLTYDLDMALEPDFEFAGRLPFGKILQSRSSEGQPIQFM